MLAHAPVTHGTRQRHEVANAKCPLSPELRRWHSTCRNQILQDQTKAMKSLGSPTPTSQAQETNLINNQHTWQMVYELNSYKWIGQNYGSSFRLTRSRSSVLPHLSKKPEQFPSNWSCWAIPNASQRFEHKWTCKTPNLIRVSWKKIEAKQLEIECLDAVGPISSINSSSNLFGKFCFTLVACAARKPPKSNLSWMTLMTLPSHDFRFLLLDPWVLIEREAVSPPWPKIVSSKPTISLSFNASTLEGWAVSSSEDGSSSIPRSSSSKRSWKICFSSFRLRLLLPAIPNFFSKSCSSDASLAAPSGSKRLEADAFDSPLGTWEPPQDHFEENESQKKRTPVSFPKESPPPQKKK